MLVIAEAEVGNSVRVLSQVTAECCHQRWFLSALRVQGMLVIAEAAEVKRVRVPSFRLRNYVASPELTEEVEYVEAFNFSDAAVKNVEGNHDEATIGVLF